MKGLYPKYNVYKIVGEAFEDEKIYGCFVLRPQKDYAARKALLAYAKNTENKTLKEDIEKWLENITETHGTLKKGQPVFKGVAFSNLGNNEEEYAKQETEVRETERLAEIGRAVEKAFAENSCVLFIDSLPNTNECYEFELTDTKQLLEWARNK